MSKFDDTIIDTHNKKISIDYKFVATPYDWGEKEFYVLLDKNTPKINKTDNPLKLTKKSYNILHTGNVLVKLDGYVYGRFGAIKVDGNYELTDLYSGFTFGLYSWMRGIKSLKHLEQVLENLQYCYNDVNFCYPIKNIKSLKVWYDNFKKFMFQLIIETDN